MNELDPKKKMPRKVAIHLYCTTRCKKKGEHIPLRGCPYKDCSFYTLRMGK